MKKKENLMGYSTTATEKGIQVRTVRSASTAITKKLRKQKKQLRGKMMTWFCSFTTENKEEYAKTKVWFMEDVKEPLKIGMMCTINGDTFYSFMRNTWIGGSGVSCHITKDDTSLYDITNIDELIQGSSGIMPAMKTGKLHLKVYKVNGTQRVHILWPLKFCSGQV